MSGHKIINLEDPASDNDAVNKIYMNNHLRTAQVQPSHSQISVDRGTSRGLVIENVGIKQLSHRFANSKGQAEFIYYHRIIINFKKLTTGKTFFLHILVNIPQDGSDLAIHPRNFTGVYLIAYGIMSKVSNIDPDKVYDYHTAFDIKPTQVVYNVDINANKKRY